MTTPHGVAELRLFGRHGVAYAGALAALRPERHHRLLAYLALGGAWGERADLAALLWPAQRRELAHANLRKAVHLARALPWAGALETTGSALRFRVSCDVHALRCRRARRPRRRRGAPPARRTPRRL